MPTTQKNSIGGEGEGEGNGSGEGRRGHLKSSPTIYILHSSFF
jgi:hypothetical protein